jgi:hypothetical protein
VVELPVADGTVFLLSQLLADHALDLVGVLEDAVEAAVLHDPLDRGLLPHLVDADEVVARLADERGDVGVLVRLDAVALEDRVAVVALELGDAARVRVEQGDVVADHLDGVAVAGDDEDVETLLCALAGERGQDVVGFVVLLRHRRDAHRLERLFEQRDLADELDGGLAAGALVLGVFAGAEGEPGDIERHREVGGLLGLQQVDEHGDEAVDGVGVLPLTVHETVDRQCVERTERQRMAVDYQEGRLFVVRHDSQPSRAHRHAGPNERVP